MTLYTEGPWTIKYAANVFGPGDRLVANANGFHTNADGGKHIIENRANARLISIAPLMHKILLESEWVIEDNNGWRCPWCYGYEIDGHKDGCKLEYVLKFIVEED